MPQSENQPKIDLGDIGEQGAPSDTPDPKTAAENSALEDHAAAIRRLEIRERTEALDQRKLYAKCTFWLVCGWLTCVLAIALLEGFGGNGSIFYVIARFPMRFQLGSSVMIALTATTTANIIAVLVIVMKFLFPPRK